MGKRYYARLTESDRTELKELINKGNAPGYKIKRAQILLKLDEISENKGWPIKRIGEEYNAHPTTISHIAKRFEEGGLESALGRKEQKNRRCKIDGNVENHILTIACSRAPEGIERWTLQLIADELVRLKVIESISATAVRTTLEKRNLSLGKRNNGVSPNQTQN